MSTVVDGCASDNQNSLLRKGPWRSAEQRSERGRGAHTIWNGVISLIGSAPAFTSVAMRFIRRATSDHIGADACRAANNINKNHAKIASEYYEIPDSYHFDTFLRTLTENPNLCRLHAEPAVIRSVTLRRAP